MMLQLHARTSRYFSGASAAKYPAIQNAIESSGDNATVGPESAAQRSCAMCTFMATTSGPGVSGIVVLNSGGEPAAIPPPLPASQIEISPLPLMNSFAQSEN